MHTITLKPKYSDQEIKKLEGYFIQDHHYDKIIDYDCDGYKEDGTPRVVELEKTKFKNYILQDAWNPYHETANAYQMCL